LLQRIATVLPPLAGLLAAGLVTPFTSFQGISFILRLPFGVYTIGSYQDFNPVKGVFVAFGLAGN